MTNPMKADVPFRPVDVALLRAIGEMLGASPMTNLIEEFHRHRSFRQSALKRRVTRTKRVLRRKGHFVCITRKCTIVHDTKSSGFLVFVDPPTAAGKIKKGPAESLVRLGSRLQAINNLITVVRVENDYRPI